MVKPKRNKPRNQTPPPQAEVIALTPHSEIPRSQRIFNFALAASVLLHILLLSIHFTAPTRKPRIETNLDVVLVNAKHRKAPEKAEVRAHHNFDGGGNVDHDVRAKTNLPVRERDEQGDALINAKKRTQELEERNRDVLTQAKGKSKVNTTRSPTTQQDTPTPSAPSATDLIDSAADIARLEAELARQSEAYAKRPRIKHIGSRAEEYRWAQYVEDWRAKVERVGTLNYPEAARGKIYGSLMLSVVIRADGSVERVQIEKSSGHKILDDAALRIVKLAAPYQAFPPAIKAEADQIGIVRTWTFTNEDKVTAQ